VARLFRCTRVRLDGLEAPAGDEDAVCALDRGWGAAVGAVDSEADRAVDWSSPALRGTTLGYEKTELGGLMSCRESRWCFRTTGSGSGGGGGG
jgi:hypothetical protein